MPMRQPVPMAAAWAQVSQWLSAECAWVPVPTDRHGAIDDGHDAARRRMLARFGVVLDMSAMIALPIVSKSEFNASLAAVTAVTG